jgi:hypothetical protein
MVTLATLSPPPIEHPVYLLGLAAGLGVALLVCRSNASALTGPSSAWTEPPAPARWRLALPVLILGSIGLLSYFAIFGSKPPISSEQRLGWGLAPLALLALALVLSPIGRAASRPIGIGVPVGGVLAVLGAFLACALTSYVTLTRIRAGSAAEILALLLPALVLGALVAWPLTTLERIGRPVVASVVGAGFMLAVSLACLLGGSIAYCQIALGLTCILLGLAVGSFVRGGGPLGLGVWLVIAGAAPALVIGARTFSELPPAPIAVLGCVPLVALLTVGLLTRRSLRRGAALKPPAYIGIVAIALAAVTAAAALALAIDPTMLADPAESSSYQP